MGFESVVLKNRSLANAVMSRMPTDAFTKRGERYALEAAQAAVDQTQAYPDFLRQHGVEVAAPLDMTQFSRLPITSKRDYVDRYSLQQLCLGGRIDRAYSIERSSGHSGGSYYWLRLPEEDALLPQLVEHALTTFHHGDSKSTLVIVAFTLGTWTSGEKMAQAVREVAARGKCQMTAMTPGTNSEEILEIARDVCPHYEQTVMIGYPPFVKTVLDEGVRRGIDWKPLNLRFVLGGEGFSEEWREHIGSIVGIDCKTDLIGVGGGYGAADVGITVGREYPATVLVRQLCAEDPALSAELFHDTRGNHDCLPTLIQYNPSSLYVEEVDNEIVFTVFSGVPLVRYNIEDTGGVIGFDDMLQALQRRGHDLSAELAKLGYGPEQIWRMPFLYVYGRSDGTVSIVGANVFPENVQAVLAQARDVDISNFKLKVETTSEFTQRLVISLEHRADSLTEQDETALSAKYYQRLVEGLRAMNADFRQSHDENPEAADPMVRVHARGTGPFAGRAGIKNRYIA